MKKILFLGGSIQQLPVLKYAKDKGYYSILCDYLEDNPGQHIVDEFYCVSTTDEYAVLDVAKQHDIDGVVAYASDPAAYTAAFVGNQLKIPSNPAESVRILTDKHLFRQFLKENNFNVPLAKGYYTYEEVLEDLHEFSFPVMVKPIDSSGSKGVTKLYDSTGLQNAFNYALTFSRSKKIIIENFITMNNKYMGAGDAFVSNNELKFVGFLNSHRREEINPFVPIGTSYPITIESAKLNKAYEEINRVVKLLDIGFGALNLEFMFDENDELYIIEIGPRNGGNMIPELLYDVTGVNSIESTVEEALGNKMTYSEYNKYKYIYYSTYVLHSIEKGNLLEVIYHKEIINNIYHEVYYKEIGEDVEVFDGSNKAIGIIFLKFNSKEEMLNTMENMEKHIEIVLK